MAHGQAPFYLCRSRLPLQMCEQKRETCRRVNRSGAMAALPAPSNSVQNSDWHLPAPMACCPTATPIERPMVSWEARHRMSYRRMKHRDLWVELPRFRGHIDIEARRRELRWRERIKRIHLRSASRWSSVSKDSTAPLGVPEQRHNDVLRQQFFGMEPLTVWPLPWP